MRRIVMLGAAALVVLSCSLAFAGDPESVAYWTVTLPMHPKLVHVPMALCVLMPAVAALAWLGVWRGWFTPRVWLIVAFLQSATVVGGAAALWSGLQDGEKVDGYASEEALETHEERAYAFVYIAAGNSVLCCVTFFLANRRRQQQLLGAVAVVALAGGSYAGYLVGDAGGRLVYVAHATDAHR